MLSYPLHEGVRDSVTGITYQQMTLAPTTDAVSLFPFVEHLLAELDTRFSRHHSVALLGLCLVPAALVTLPDPDVKSQTGGSI